MKSRRLLALVFGSCFLFALAPTVVCGQATGPTTTGPTTTGPTTGANPATSTPVSTTTAPIKSVTSGTGSATSVPSNANPFVPNYGDPLSMGKPANYAATFGPPTKDTVTFGKGIYSTTTGAVASSASTITNPANGFTMFGQPRNAPYSTRLSSDLPLVKHSAGALQANVRSILDRSSFIRHPREVQVSASGGVIQLNGRVASAKERWLIEGMVRTTRGVNNVQNNLTIVPTN